MQRRATGTNRRGSWKPSTYIAITRVRGSDSQYVTRSHGSTSTRLPIEQNIDIPAPRSAASSSIDSPSAPLCVAKAIGPGGGMMRAKLALRRTASSVLITPMQFGPAARIPYRSSNPRNAASRSRPSGRPVSPKPAEMIASARTPFSPHSRITSSATSLRTITTARSTGSGISSTDR